MIGYCVILRQNIASTSHSPSHFCPQSSAFSLSYLSPLPTTRYALFCAMEPSQPLSHQSLPHAFLCNGGCAPVNNPSLPVLCTFFQVTYSLSSFLSHPSKNCRSVGGFFPNRNSPRSVLRIRRLGTEIIPPHPTANGKRPTASFPKRRGVRW